MINNNFIGTILPNIYVNKVTIYDDKEYDYISVDYSFLEISSKETFSWSDLPTDILKNIKIGFRVLVNASDDDLFNIKSNLYSETQIKLKDDPSIYDIFIGELRKNSSQKVLEDSLFDYFNDINLDQNNILDNEDQDSLRELLIANKNKLLIQYKSKILSRSEFRSDKNSIDYFKFKKTENFFDRVDLIIFLYYDFEDKFIPDIYNRPTHIQLIKDKTLAPLINVYKYYTDKTYNGPVEYVRVPGGRGTIIVDKKTMFTDPPRPLKESFIDFKQGVIDKRLEKIPSFLDEIKYSKSQIEKKYKYISNTFYCPTEKENYSNNQERYKNIKSFSELSNKGVLFFDFIRFYKENTIVSNFNYPIEDLLTHLISVDIYVGKKRKYFNSNQFLKPYRVKDINITKEIVYIKNKFNDDPSVKKDKYPILKITFKDKSFFNDFNKDIKSYFYTLRVFYNYNKESESIDNFYESFRLYKNFFLSYKHLIEIKDTKQIIIYYKRIAALRQRLTENILDGLKYLGIKTDIPLTSNSLYTMENIIDIYYDSLNPKNNFYYIDQFIDLFNKIIDLADQTVDDIKKLKEIETFDYKLTSINSEIKKVCINPEKIFNKVIAGGGFRRSKKIIFSESTFRPSAEFPIVFISTDSTLPKGDILYISKYFNSKYLKTIDANYLMSLISFNRLYKQYFQTSFSNLPGRIYGGASPELTQEAYQTAEDLALIENFSSFHYLFENFLLNTSPEIETYNEFGYNEYDKILDLNNLIKGSENVILSYYNNKYMDKYVNSIYGTDATILENNFQDLNFEGALPEKRAYQYKFLDIYSLNGVT